MPYDVIVIGAGLAGFMAAEAACEKGARVLILARGMGTLPLTSGCIDVLGYFPTASPVPLSSPLGALNRLREFHPHHPYSKLGAEKIISALERFRELARADSIPYCGRFDSNILIPTALGTFHPTCLAPETMKKGDLSLPGRVLIVGFEGLKDFSAPLTAENLNLLQAGGKISPSFRAKTLPETDWGFKALTTLNLAGALDREDVRDRLARRIRPLLNPGEKVGLPAVLGFHSSHRAWADLQEKLAAEIFEVPLPPPSIAGLRLYNLFRSRLRAKGVRIIIGLSVLQPLIEGNEIRGIGLGESRKSPAYRAPAYVLATGKFVGGGLDTRPDRVFETLLDLPVSHPPSRKDWFNQELLTPAGQPFNSFGVEVNEDLQPVDSRGRVLYRNLFAAGGILAHADSMAEKSGGGVAIATGYAAGRLAANKN